MLVKMSIFLGTLILMGAVAWHANATLPDGQLPMGRTDKPNTNRVIVLLQIPVIYIVSLVVILIRDHVEASVSDPVILSTLVLLFVSFMILAVQQAQLWGIRRIMRKRPL
jgi:hypothetical protein